MGKARFLPSGQQARESFLFSRYSGWATGNGRDRSLIFGFHAHFHRPGPFHGKGQKSSPKVCSRHRKSLDM